VLAVPEKASNVLRQSIWHKVPNSPIVTVKHIVLEGIYKTSHKPLAISNSKNKKKFNVFNDYESEKNNSHKLFSE